jgi:diguanylate cyclase (GGDEF)-like protein
MTLSHKTLIFFSSFLTLLVLVLMALSVYSFRQFSLYTAERHALSVAESVKVSLTESMINGTIDRRAKFLERLREMPGVQALRVVRGPAVVTQYGPGLAEERPANESDRRVLAEGKAFFDELENEDAPLIRAIIPYIATDHGTPHCLQCHAVSNGTVLGEVVIDISLSEVRRQTATAIFLVSLSVLVASVLALLLWRRLLRPLVETASAVKDVTAQAVGGNFSGRIVQRTSDEVGEIAVNLNRLMEFLDKEIGIIGKRVAELMRYRQTGGNQLVAVSEMVEGLVEVAQFKQAIEEDLDKLEIYQRLAQVLSSKYDIHQFSIYEVASSKNRITPMVVDGETGAHCHWCDPQILIDAGACRARRTGHEVNATEFPGLCTMFRDDSEGSNTHICLPIVQSGEVGCVVQLVFAREHSQLAQLWAPFIAVYLREAAPVLEAKRLMEHLRESSMRDALTGLFNRRFLEEYVTTLVATSQRRKSGFSVLMLDLDYFKQVNDTFGHETGDKVLKTLADILVKSVRGSDLVIRYGGEEFLIILLDSGADDAVKVAEKIRVKVAETKIALPGTVLQKTISIGIADFPADSDTFWQVVKFADVALYEAKRTGRNRVLRFAPEMWKDTEKY